MKWQNRTLQSRLYIIAAIVLFAGLSASALLYFYSAETYGKEAFDDYLNSKRYRHEVEVYGGKVSVLADQMDRWFQGLWEAENRACTVAGITIFISFVAYHTPPDHKGSEEEKRPD
jgi:hypothetical protein